MVMGRKLVIVVFAFIVLAVVIFFYFKGKEYVIRIPEEQIKEKLQEKLPITKTFFIFISLTIDNPRLHLKEGSNRIYTGLDATLNINIKNLNSFSGIIDVSGGVAYQSESKTFYLTDPVIENLDIQGVPEKYTDKVKKAASKLIIKWYRENPIYSLSSLDGKQAVAKLLLRNVTIENKELVLTLGV